MARLNRRPAPRPVTEPFLRSAPRPAPLDMPAQDFDTRRPHPQALPASAAAKRMLLLGATGVLTALAGAVMIRFLAPGGITALDAVTYVLFLVLFAWIAFAFVSSLAGFAVLWARPHPPTGVQPVIFSRTALLLPTYNEDPGRILAAVQAIHEDLARLGVAKLYDIFVLSDTRDARTARAEAVGIIRVRARLGHDARIFYRRRAANTDRKAGNIAEWVTAHGADYPFMLVLDADSLMTGDTIVRMTAAMEADPGLGLLQTSPTTVNGESLFARLQQFAGRTYGQMLSAGQDWWSGAEGNFWGHNAIIRTRAFAEQAGLPHLPGRKPFGGHILSHDFVEAALLRRGGWAVRLDPRLGGSFEEAPPTILDMARRDRRWCQGNLQHTGVLRARGLHWVSRLHMVRGILSYVCSPLWLALLCTGAGAWVEQANVLPEAAVKPAGWLFGLTMLLLFAPKLLAGLLSLRNGQARAAGGPMRMALSVVVESILAALVAPALMLMQSVAVIEVLLGRDAGWGVQQRDVGRMSRGDAWRTHRGHMAIGLMAAGVAVALDPAMFWWTSPVYAGLALSAPLSLVLASPELGKLSARLGLFLTPEERRIPTVVSRANELRERYDAEAGVRTEIERMFREPVRAYFPQAQPMVVPAHYRFAAE